MITRFTLELWKNDENLVSVSDSRRSREIRDKFEKKVSEEIGDLKISELEDYEVKEIEEEIMSRRIGDFIGGVTN